MNSQSSRTAIFGPDPRKRILVSDLLGSQGVRLDSRDDRLAMNDTLIEGNFFHQELRPGLFLHLGDAREERTFTVTSQMREELSCVFFLDGEVDLKIGDRRFAFKGGGRDPISGVAIMSADADSFERTSRGSQHVRHLVISATPEWLHLDGLEQVNGGRHAAGLLTDHLAEHRWMLTPRAVELVRQIVTPSSFLPELRNLYLEGRAVEIVAETLAAILQTDRRVDDTGVLARRDLMRLVRAKELISARLVEPLNMEMVAREAGISASGLQRLFRLSEGCSVFEYVRRLRLERASHALQAGTATVLEASAIAGYSNPANFATAFKRQFGITPREVLVSRRLV